MSVTETAHSEISHLIACSRWAFLTSGFWFLLAIISAREAPVMALWNLTARRVLFFWISSYRTERWWACWETLPHECGGDMKCQETAKELSLEPSAPIPFMGALPSWLFHLSKVPPPNHHLGGQVFNMWILGRTQFRPHNIQPGSSLVAECLGLWAFTASGSGLIPGWETDIPHAAQHCPEEKKNSQNNSCNYLKWDIQINF